MRATRRDANQGQIIEALWRLGFQVWDLAGVGPNVWPGWPDLLVVRNGRIALVEVKSAVGTRTEPETEFALTFAGPLYTVRTIGECVKLAQTWPTE